MSIPKVSICIPAYQQTECLQKTLSSVLMQTYTNFEVVITDDSPDYNIKNLVDSFQFKNVRYYKNEKRLGSPENWNECIRRSKGQYVKLLHHDDWFSYENSLEEFVKMLDNNPESDFAFSAALVYNEKENTIGTFMPGADQIDTLKKDPSILFFGNLIGPPSSTIFRRTNLQFDPRLIWLVDLDFYIKALKRNPNFIRSEKTLITSTTEGLHQITNHCRDNKTVELVEYTYLYQNIRDDVSFQLAFKFFSFFRKLLSKYKVRSKKEILNCGYTGEIPFLVRMAVLFKRF